MPVIVEALSALDRLRGALPPLDASAERAGRHYWQTVVDVGLAGDAATFAMPDRLARRPPAG
jgi:hypothetical protein